MTPALVAGTGRTAPSTPRSGRRASVAKRKSVWVVEERQGESEGWPATPWEPSDTVALTRSEAIALAKEHVELFGWPYEARAVRYERVEPKPRKAGVRG